MRINPKKLEQATEGLSDAAIARRLGQPRDYLFRVKQRARQGREFEPTFVYILEEILNYKIRLQGDAGDRGEENGN